VAIEGKVGTRWYLWVTRSPSVVFYCIDPSRSAAVPGAHFAGLQVDQVIIVCDRYSAYKKLARLAANILLAFCWAHVRRDFLDAGRAFPELEPSALQWKERIAILQTLALWGINPRHWLTAYLTACAANGGNAPRNIEPFLPWSMEEARRAALSRPYPSQAPPVLPPIDDSS